jgi:hypothetical protein
LHVLALSEGAADDHRHVRVGNVEAFVEYSCRHERPEVSVTEAIENLVAFLTADIAGQRHH